MLKFAVALGITIEWLTGPAVGSAVGFAFAALRTAMATLAAWMVLEALRAVVRAIEALDDRA
jgi:hypothetical protein